MPEGHTLHRLAIDLRELASQPLRVSSPQGRFSDEAAEIDGTICMGAEAYGKHLFIEFAGNKSVHVHLGMRGKFLRYAPPGDSPMKQVRLRLQTSDVAWDLVAPTKCELLGSIERSNVITRLGPDPLRDDADAEDAIRRLRSHRGSIAAALLDQSVIAGAGNVFRAEVLHALELDPFARAGDLDDSTLVAIWKSLQAMMQQAVEDGRIVTVDRPDRLELPESESRHVYKRETCVDCNGRVSQRDIDGRTVYWCAHEQTLTA